MLLWAQFFWGGCKEIRIFYFLLGASSLELIYMLNLNSLTIQIWLMKCEPMFLVIMIGSLWVIRKKMIGSLEKKICIFLPD